MMTSNLTSLLTDFATLPDPRIARRRQYPLLEILLVCVSAGVSGYGGWEEIADFGCAKLAWLRTYLPFEQGIASHDTLNRVMSRLDPRAFEKCFIDWVRQGLVLPDGAQICVDGKRLRRSATARQQQTPRAAGGVPAVHLLHAWCDEAGLCLGQYQTPDKANEITALPTLLDLLDVRGCLLSMDAIGCQKSITQAITAAGADYLLVLKGNQAALQTAVLAAFAASQKAEATSTPPEKPVQGRHETRTCRVLPATVLPAQLRGPDWHALHTLVEVRATRRAVGSEQLQTETRYYLSSRQATAADFQGYVRRHWGVENRLHWVLDVVFGEDACRKRAGDAATNYAVIRKFVLNLLHEQPEKISLNRKMNRCALADEYREKCLRF
ncbi:ISAs1 family transposase [Hymenobacter sp. IS2118]|uniref:ISAs1 family transposase n=1 Tax=Hymenobacter sp. IS2118 TaxID=1505605 RepID=UPI0009DCF08B|nr:ISAs1 family transposase [Hymenobacter sp. IS2118]